MKGKEKCEFLKEIRKRMAELNGIPYEPRECTYEGDCTGTCPFCEKEAAELMAALKKKEAEGAEIKKDDAGILAIELGVNGGSSNSFMSEKNLCELGRNEKREPGDMESPNEELSREEKEKIAVLQEMERRAKRKRGRGLMSKFLSNFKLTEIQGVISNEEI